MLLALGDYGPLPRREIVQADALDWMNTNQASSAMSVITSLPDVSEVSMSLDTWRVWFIDAAARTLRWLGAARSDGLVIFYQSDIRLEGRWIDKGYLVMRALEEADASLIAHKIVCRSPPGTISLGRPSYSHMICARPGPSSALRRPGPDVIPDAGHSPWSRAMGTLACRVALELVRDETSTRTIVDPFCGRGTVLAAANTMGFDAIGVDISAKRCRAARALVIGAARLGLRSPSDDSLLTGARVFDQRGFFEAHEIWEERWRVATDETDRRLLQGLIQLAACLHKRDVVGAPDAAARLFSRASEKLTPLASHPRFDVEGFREALVGWALVGPPPSVVQFVRPRSATS